MSERIRGSYDDVLYKSTYTLLPRYWVVHNRRHLPSTYVVLRCNLIIIIIIVAYLGC